MEYYYCRNYISHDARGELVSRFLEFTTFGRGIIECS